MKRTALQRTQYNPVINCETKGFLDNNDLETLRKNCYEGYILKGMEYRPDVVANYYLGDPTKSWMITYVNDFFNGIEDYTFERKIKIPRI